MGDRFVSALARLVLAVFFRRVLVRGLEPSMSSGPVLVVANHVNSLIDAVLVAGTFPRMPRFLAKSTLWNNPGLRPFLALGKVIPVYRRQDPGVDASLNQTTFARCHEVLRDGGVIAIFPEGISHNEPELQPLRTGVARIALEAEERFGPLGVKILPAGLTFDAKGTFRSSALVRFGAPIEPRAQEGEDPRDTVLRLTEEVALALRAQTLNFRSWDQARRLQRAVELYGQPRLQVPRRASLAQVHDLQRAFLEGYTVLAERFPERVARVEEAVDRYDRLLTEAGLRDDQVGSVYPAGKVASYVATRLLSLLLGLPLAVVGTLLNWLPYRIPGGLARRFAATPDVESTYKLFPAVVLFPLFWLGEAFAAGYLAGWPAGLALAVVAPLSGWMALRFHERRRSFLSEVGAYLKLRPRRKMARELKSRREEVQAAVQELVETYSTP